MNMMQPYLDRQHHVYFDRLFARSKLTDDLAQRGTYSCCTVMLNRRGLPARARKMKVEQCGEVQFQQKGNVLLTAWKDKRQVSVLSTNSNAEMIAVGNLMKQKPSTIQHYNAHMGGVDLADQFRSYYCLQGWATIKEVVVLCILVSVGCHHGEHLDNLHAHSTEMTQKQFFFWKIIIVITHYYLVRRIMYG